MQSWMHILLVKAETALNSVVVHVQLFQETRKSEVMELARQWLVDRLPTRHNRVPVGAAAASTSIEVADESGI